MSAPQIRPLVEGDAAELLRFELANRAFFETWVAAREPAFYSETGVQAAIVASRSVALCLAAAFDTHGLWRVEATARPENLGSVRVLERNGFRAFGHSRRSFQRQGPWFDRVHFECRRDAPARDDRRVPVP